MQKQLEAAGIEWFEACTLVMLRPTSSDRCSSASILGALLWARDIRRRARPEHRVSVAR